MQININDELLQVYSKHFNIELFKSESEMINKLLENTIRKAGLPGYDHDLLTGCLTPPKLDDIIHKETWGKSWNDPSEFNLRFLCIDIDNFKHYLDIYGLTAGDDVLKKIATHLITVYTENRVIRLGGDEFIVLLNKYDTVNLLSIPEITLKYSIVVIKGKKNQRRNHHINSFISFQINRGIIEATTTGTEIQEYIDIPQ